MSKIFRVLTLALMLLSVLVTFQLKANAQEIAAGYYNMPVLQVAAKTSEPLTYLIKKGDSLSIIASKYKLNWQSLYCDNKKLIGDNPNLINPGERIDIPSKVISCAIVLPAVEKRVTATEDQLATVSHVSREPAGSLQDYALSLLGGSQSQYDCLAAVIAIESSWNIHATNPSSGAYGIPQALPGSKMSVAGSDWESNGYTQLRWMIEDYIPATYGTPCGALAHEESAGYY